ncbi:MULTISPECIES: aldo/keto reductase [unclassified Nocardioides]|uniref:aldo/keto reductase n=1 Tax=unclassified Nocardioides TaxID=2615069 RepID=UPI0006F76C92|nr:MULTISPECIES: aldo/keto reductase [unclassified Nocardioides]KQY56922.1 aldo/keto reductase [Nocardioides sp. Root140]KRF13044.1 aldo/keto reductase [Nocardioides sp. Soil796]
MTDYRPLGRTGLKVSPLTLGTMMFGGHGNPDHDDSIAIIHRALDSGINLVDTADVYSQGESEEIVGKALKGRRDNVVLATKFHGRLGEDVNEFGNSRRWIIREVENSLRRLQTDWIDLYQVHRPEPDTDIDETLGALSDLVHQGKIRYVGTSTFQPSQIVEAQHVAHARGRERPVTEQPPYSLLVRHVEREVLPVAEQYGLGVLPWSPLAGGWLSGRYNRDAITAPTSTRAGRQPARHDPTRADNARKLETVLDLTDLAEENGLTLIHLALAFVLQHPAVTSAIIGPRTHEHLEAALGADKITLTDDILDRIDEIVPPGTTYNVADEGWQHPAITDASLRRRPEGRGAR